eukprot:m.8861 g.8861  ORF g.8861 m.8861 type:complete len:116 (+) comp5312_c0_seq1:879-1226(+)
MPPKKEKESKAAIAAKASKGGGKAKKKKWSKGKTRDKLNNQCMFNKTAYDKLMKEVPSYKLITPAIVSDRLQIRGSLARRAIRELQDKGLIVPVVKHSKMAIYTRATAAKEEGEE